MSNPMSNGKGPIVSMEILSVDFRVDSRNRDARMFWCMAIFWYVRQTNCLTSCRKCGQLLSSVSRGACCVISAMVRSTSQCSCRAVQFAHAVLRYTDVLRDDGVGLVQVSRIKPLKTSVGVFALPATSGSIVAS